MVFWIAMGVMLGGRVGYVFFYKFDEFLANPLWLFKVWEGGMSFHGGLLGVALAIYLFGRKKANANLLEMGDFIVPMIPIGLGLGRIGNFIGQELWGRTTDGWYAMVFPADPEQLSRHPSQLYQAALEGVVLGIILWWFSRVQRPTGAVSGLFLLFYGVFRFIVEFVRQPDLHLQGQEIFGWMTRGQLLSLPMIAAGIILIIWAYKHHGNSAQTRA